ncbi:ATP-binding protein [Acidipropionibacterium virtanenii]|uniref:ATP-binding protein n=1 Tax=Acidipropionibacterium virtanenii TaxID=2057246 RepID=UPI001C68BBFD
MTIESTRQTPGLRNASRARIFREAGIMEQWGTGVQRVFGRSAEVRAAHLEFERIHDRVTGTIRIEHHRAQLVVQNHDYTNSNDGRHEVVMLSAAVNGPVHRNDLLAAGLQPLSQNYSRHIVPFIDGGCWR